MTLAPTRIGGPWVPEQPTVSIPVVARPQVLPLQELPWELFEQLCARLAQRVGDVEQCQRYGVKGQRQQGIDIYVRRRDPKGYSVWQCKRHQTVTAARITQVVEDFLSGTWESMADEFVFATSSTTENTEVADAIEREARRLHKRKIGFTVLGKTQLSERLKTQPDLVDDCFGREWVRAFCGNHAVESLSDHRLSRNDVVRLRALLRNCYAEHFEVTDPGLPSLTGLALEGHPLPLVQRFVPPDLVEQREVLQTSYSISQEPAEDTGLAHESPTAHEPTIGGEPRPRQNAWRSSADVRRPAIEWLSDGERSIVLGEPGTGKSTLLRCVLLDLLSTEPKYQDYAIRCGNYLPLWIPFAMWVRLVSESEDCSLGDVVIAWLRKVSAPNELVNLAHQAVEDSRLMLFVDGLDEWNDETAARTALTLLEQFVRERSIPAVAASRPLGYRRLGGVTAEWRRGSLAGLSPSQQETLTERWFLYRSAASLQEDSRQSLAHQTEARAKAEAAEHMQDIHRDGQLARLAETPLLLNGLIALAFQHLRLPRSRFKAYEELTRLLLEEQPSRRERASYARKPTRPLNPETRERALARLAWEIHSSPSSDALEMDTAREALSDFCTDYLRTSAADSLTHAQTLLSTGKDTLGILVEKSQTAIGFPHRAFQEFLAARHLSSLPIRNQRAAITQLFAYPQWHDVLLCLFYLTTRKDEVDDFIDIVKSLDLEPDLDLSRAQFLAEVAFGDLHCSAEKAMMLAESTFRLVETGPYERTREALIRTVVSGLDSDVVRTAVEQRIRLWFPCRRPYRTGVYDAAGDWAPTDETLTLLWRGIHDNESWHRAAAAKGLARCFGGDCAVRERLRKLLVEPAEPELMAYALHSLCLGWGNDPQLEFILAAALKSPHTSLKCVAVIHRVARGEHTEVDRKALEDLTSRHVPWEWRTELAHAYLEGWPNDLGLKDRALRSYAHSFTPYTDDVQLDREVALIVLLQGYAGDDDVAEEIAKSFENDHLLPRSMISWTEFVKAFSAHENVGTAADRWLSRKVDKKSSDAGELYWDAKLCLLSRSRRAKDILLRRDSSTGEIYASHARCLFEGWGMTDREAAGALLSLANSDSALSIADLLPDILGHTEECFETLADLLPESTAWGRLVLKGLWKLTQSDNGVGLSERVNDAIASADLERWPPGVFGGAIEYFPSSSPVEELALQRVDEVDAPIDAIAVAYGSRDVVRKKLLDACCSVPESLRTVLVDQLGRFGPEDDFAYLILSKFDEETGESASTAAAVNCARSAVRREQHSSLTFDLDRSLESVGSRHDARRQSAFAALLELDQLEASSVLRERVEGQDDSSDLLKIGFVQSNNRLASHVAERWNRLKTAFNGRLINPSSLGEDFFCDVASYATAGIANEIVGERIADEREPMSAAWVGVCARVQKGTPELRDMCLKLIANFKVTNWIETAPGIAAAEIVAQQFIDDDVALEKLGNLVDSGTISSALTIALRGKVGTEIWEKLLRQLSKLEQSGYRGHPLILLPPARFCLAAANLPTQELLPNVLSEMASLSGDIWDFASSCQRSLLTRFLADEDVREAAYKTLVRGTTDAAKVNFPTLIRRSGGDSEELRQWARKEVRRQYDQRAISGTAVDLSTESIRPVAHALFDYLQ